MPTLKGTMVDFKAGPGKGHGYLSLPKTSRGGVLVLHAWWGLNDFFKSFCDRLAQEGFTTLAPDLRQGKIAHTIDEAKAMLSSANEEETFPPVVLGGLDHLMSTSKDRAFGVVGFSMGAAAVVRSAALVEPVDAAVPVSGPAEWHVRPGCARRGRGSRRTALVWRLPGGTAAAGALTGVRIARQIPTGESPASVIGRIAPAPVLVVHGTKDPFFPVEEARDLYERAGEPKALWVIPGGGHAEGLFTEPGRPVARGAVDGFAEELVGRLAALEGPAKFRV